MENMPLVSIVIPVYNGANYLREAIDSALLQTYPNCEVLVVNDGSTDGGATERIALSYGKRIRYFRKENGGVATALNRGIHEMKGEYFSWLSHDDLYYPHKIQREMEALRENGDMTRIIYEDYEALEADNGSKTSFSHEPLYGKTLLEKSVFPVLYGLLYGCAMLIHRMHFQRIGLFNDKLKTTQDYELYFRMLRNQKLLYLPEILVTYRNHREQGTKTIKVYDQEQEALYERFVSELTEQEIIEFYGSRYMFYQQMCAFLRGGSMEKTYRLMTEKLMDQPIPSDTHEKLEQFRAYVERLACGKANRICIFCAGERGIRLFYELKSRLISVDYFCDNDEGKYGYFVGGVHCIPLEVLGREKEHTLVIVSAISCGSVIEQLKKEGFPYVISKAELDKEMFRVPPLKWFHGLEGVRDIDYSAPEIAALTDRFRELMFDICRHYEGKL